MKKFFVLLSSIAFIMVISLGTANGQEPEKNAQKPKTEKCCTKKTEKCPSTCTKKGETPKKEEKKEAKKEKKNG